MPPESAGPGSIQSAQFEWRHDLGIGHLDVTPIAYDRAYFEHYSKLADTPMGRALTAARLALVLRHWDRKGLLVDVGIGAGQFVEACVEDGIAARGADVCPVAIEWLAKRGLLHNLDWPNGSAHASVMTFWDSIEHMPDPAAAIGKARGWAFVALPVCDTRAEWVLSKHFKPGEHLWYWSERGFALWAEAQGFRVEEISRVETDLGREGISSYALRRIRT